MARPTLLISPVGSRDREGLRTPVLDGEVLLVPGVHHDAWQLTGETRNLVTNPSVETNLTTLQVTSGLTMTRDTSQASHGIASVRVDAPAGSGGKRLVWYNSVSSPPTGITNLAAAVDLWGTGTVTVEVSGDYADATTFTGTRTSAITLNAVKTRYAAPIKAIDPAKTIAFVRISVWLVSDTATFWADAAQVEEGSLSTRFTVGTRAASTVRIATPAAIVTDGITPPGPSFDPALTVHFPSDIHVGRTGSVERRAAVAPDWITLNSQIAHRVLPGDITDTPGSTTQRTEAETWLLSIDTRDRWDVIAGNHDISGATDGNWFASAWGYGSRVWTYDVGDDYRIIGIIPENHGSGNYYLTLFASDLANLEAALSATSRQCVIVFHAPLKDTTGGGFPSSDIRYHANMDDEIRAVLNAHDNAFMWVSGHTHVNTTDPNIFIEKNVGSRSVLHLSCSAIAFVNGTSGGVASLGPLQSPVVTFDSGHVTVRWRDHDVQGWKIVDGATSKTLPPYPVAPGNVLIRYRENGVAGVAVLNGPGQFGSYGEITSASNEVVISSTQQTEVESVIVFDRSLVETEQDQVSALADWSSTFVNAEPIRRLGEIMIPVVVINTPFTGTIAVLTDGLGNPVTAATWTDGGSLTPSSAPWPIDPIPFIENTSGNVYRLVDYTFDELGEWILIPVANGDPLLTAPVSFWVTTAAQAYPAQFLSGQRIEVVSPVTETGAVTIYRGDDYDMDESRALTWNLTGASNLTGATVTLTIAARGQTITSPGTVTNPGAATQTVTVELTAAQTATLPVGAQSCGYDLAAVLANGHTVTLARGRVTVTADVP